MGIAALLAVGLCLLLWALSGLQQRASDGAKPAPRTSPAKPSSRLPVPAEAAPAVSSVPEPEPEPEVAVAEPAVAPQPEPALSDPVAFVVRDLWNLAPVPVVGFLVEAARDDASLQDAGAERLPDSAHWRIASDAYGELRLPEGATLLATAPGEDWRLADVDRSAADERTVWVYTTMRIRGAVWQYGDHDVLLPRERVRVDATVGAGTRSPGEGGARPDAVAELRRLAEHDLVSFPDVARLDSSGHFLAELPRVPGMTLRARVAPEEPATQSGWRGGSAAITEEMCAARSGNVELYIEGGFRLEGTLLDDAGEPVANARVTLHVVREITEDQANPEWLKSQGGGAITGDIRTGDYVTDQIQHATTDEHGRFELSAKRDGTATLWVQPSTDHRTEGFPFGTLSQGPREQSLTVRRVDASRRVQLIDHRGRAVTRPLVRIHDITHRIVQEAVRLEVGANGDVPARFLQVGRRYRVWPHKKGDLPIYRGDFDAEWDGGSEMHLRPRER